MVLTIYDRRGAKRADVSPGDSSTQQKEVQGDNVLALSFTHYEHIPLDVDDYADFDGERYWLTEKYVPAQRSDGEWVYDVKLYGVESLIKRFLVLETTDGNAEPAFTLTATPREHVAMVVRCINGGLGGSSDWKVGRVDGTGLIVVDYEGTYCDEALRLIAGKVGGGAEWWVEGQTVNVCRCELGEEIALGYGAGLTGLERASGASSKFYTRLFPIGSSRNIDAAEYGYGRLMLPGGRQYVELHADEYGIYDHYEKDAFVDIYPRRTGEVSSVRSKSARDAGGRAFTIYYFRDDTLTFDPNEYELAGETKRVSFQDGDLAGLGSGDDHSFEVNFDSATREFEIITIWPYDDDTQLPGGNLVPKAGNHYILWNVRMPKEYYALAEEELLSAVERYNEEHWKDISVYKAPTDHVWVEENDAGLYVGRRVRLESVKYFPEDGYRQSRITKITRRVNLPSQMDLEISDALQTGALDRVNDSIVELKTYTKARTDGVALPDIIRSWDGTAPTDSNLFSARRCRQEFLRRDASDTARGDLSFEGSCSFGGGAAFRSDVSVDGGALLDVGGPSRFGGAARFAARLLLGDAGVLGSGGEDWLERLAVRALLRFARAEMSELEGAGGFSSGLGGRGLRLWNDAALGWCGELDSLTVRRGMVIYELLIRKVRAVGGSLLVSAASGRVRSASLEGGVWRLEMEEANEFVAGDLALCQSWRGTGETLRHYHVRVAGADASGVWVEESEFGGAVPAAGDELVLRGSVSDASRQSMVLIEAADAHPRISVVDGMRTKTGGEVRTAVGDLDGVGSEWCVPSGHGLYSDNVFLRGKLVVDIDGRAADVATQFGVVRGEIAARVRESEVSANEYVRNCDFAQGLWCWGLTGGGTKTFTAGDAVASAGGSLLALGKDVALSEADGVRVLEFLGGRGTTEVSQRAGDLLGAPSGDVTVSVWARKYGDTREGAVLQVRAGGVTRASRRASEMGDGWVRVDATFAWTGGPVSVRSVLGHFAVRAVTMQRDARAVAESVLELRADQASLSTRMGAAEAKIATSVQVDGEGNVTSRVVIGGDKVVIRGATSVNGAFTVDEEGFMRATGGGLVRGLTVEGAVNNLVTEIDLSGSVADAVAGGYVSDAGGLSSGIHADPKAVCLNPWACGGVVVLDDTSGTHGWELFLPTAYCAGAGLVFSPGLDAATTPEEGLRRLRQLIGKRLCVYTRTGASAEDWKPWLMGDVLCVSSDGLNLSWADNWRPAGDAVVPGYGGKAYHPLVLSDQYCVWLECCVGVYGGYECIYWKIYEGAETLENCIY